MTINNISLNYFLYISEQNVSNISPWGLFSLKKASERKEAFILL